jgi:DNA-binding transcriptional regulator GbsR (MarR family)
MGGNFCRKVGLPRSLGQIYGLLFLSTQPLSLEDITEALGISKASASVGARQLVAWGALRQVWIRGDRRDHYEMVPELAEVLRRGYHDFVKPRLEASEKRYSALMSALEEDLASGALSRQEHEICAERLKQLGRIQKQLQAAAPLVEGLL